MNHVLARDVEDSMSWLYCFQFTGPILCALNYGGGLSKTTKAVLSR